jgi:hypothetical protein
MVRKRGEATKRILERLKREPAYPKVISDELGIPISTVNHNLRNVLRELGLIKQLKNGKYAVQEFSPQIEEVKDTYDRMRRKLLRSPKPEEMAYLLEIPLLRLEIFYTSTFLDIPSQRQKRSNGPMKNYGK